MRKTVLITGASMGIGLEFAHVFARNGYDLFLVARSGDKLQSLAQELEGRHSIQAQTLSIDLSKTTAAQDVYEETKRLGLTIDVLVNNAGFGDFGLFHETDWEKERQMIALNITALAHFTKLYSKEMVTRKSGKILNVASVAAFQPGPGMAVYFATKAFVLSFSEAIREELAGSGVTITVLCPGPTESNFIEAANLQESRLFKLMKPDSSRNVAEYGYDSLMNGRVVAIPGFMNSLLPSLIRFLPRFLVRKASRVVQAKVTS